jgi:quercetin dioxygenase-like cupin family protein
MNTTCKILLFLLFVLGIPNVPSGTGANSQLAKETPLMTKELPDVPGKEGLVERVVLSPGEIVPPHRHNADVFAYVLEGSIITQLLGGNPRTVHAGEVFYESPTDVHVETRNASTTQAATLLVFFVKNTGAPPTVAAGEANTPR